MNIIIFIFCFVETFGRITGTDKRTLEINNACLTEYGINPEVYYQKEPDITTYNNEQVYCFAACVYKEYGVMNSDGSINTDKIEAYFDENNDKERDIFFSVYNECAGEEKDCKLVQCIFENLKGHW